ncbi:MAG: guanine deaminase [Peptococcaceae bacterium]|nr:guanine deaminase [Peptococcaceae bacterium]
MGLQIFKGNIIFAPAPGELKICARSHIVVKDGIVEGIYERLPEEYGKEPVKDYGERLILPGFVDLHVHASQLYQCGLGLDRELIDWLNDYTFYVESRFSDPAYAREAYSLFADELVRQGTVRACIFATIHKESTGLLFEILQEKGIGAFVGKVNMDRNCPDFLQEETEVSIKETEELIARYGRHPLVKPILTPRFAPACSGELLKAIGDLAKKYNLPVQSHLSENPREVEWVRELFPSHPTYSDVYLDFGLFGRYAPALMAHGIYLTDRELDLIKANDVMLVHCPESNINLASGIMPVRKWLNRGIRVGLGSDVGASHNLAMSKAIVRAVQLSKLLKIFSPRHEKPLTIAEAFYMATKGGGSFFGKVGSFEKGYSFDAVIVEDDPRIAGGLSLEEQFQRFLYTGDANNIIACFVAGRQLGLRCD